MSDLKQKQAKKKKVQQKRRRKGRKLRHDQASDSVVWSIVRRHNASRRSYCNFHRYPNFTPQTRNLLQIDAFRTSAFRRQTVGLGTRKAPKGSKQQFFVLKMNRRGRVKKPRRSIAKAQIVVGSKKRIAKQIDAQTRYRGYRTELNKLAQKRMWRVLQNRTEYKARVAKKSRRAKKVAQFRGDDEADDNAGGNADDPNMQIVD